MVLPTFHHLSEEKQARVRDALLNEFSQYPLAEAQVARIVKDAGIARGAFYKYFADLPDAYNYVFGVAMYEIHRTMPEMPTVDNVDAYMNSIRQFVVETDKAGYRKLIEQHYRYNEGFLGSEPTKLVDGADAPARWAITVLYHQTVRDIVLDPDSMDQRIEQLRTVLQKR
ncbi:TetR/AcrR family transcriptional regulator [Lacticaseibacillus kribbianus]|uniref:TetR/AcrR family transcriptional regulator n=1 Tax=Lacticaseibacillus kribbianus TaxID=2926292 RepID=UPI001CD68193|nr:TetR/AcrR family transcriptional regulator [Lacticaseibacillus kribbianus]